jgi:ABC-type maltose transport system permease subunit
VFAAGALIAALPIMTIYLILQDQIVGGLTQGAVKG